jgi:hypothetical protein
VTGVVADIGPQIVTVISTLAGAIAGTAIGGAITFKIARQGQEHERSERIEKQNRATRAQAAELLGVVDGVLVDVSPQRHAFVNSETPARLAEIDRFWKSEVRGPLSSLGFLLPTKTERDLVKPLVVGVGNAITISAMVAGDLLNRNGGDGSTYDQARADHTEACRIADELATLITTSEEEVVAPEK